MNVRGDAAHPAINCRIGRIDLLLHGRSGNCSACDINLGPLRSGRCSTSAARRVNHPERFGAADLAILNLLHDSIAEAVEGVGGTGLRDNVCTRNSVARLADDCRGAKRTAAAAVRPWSKGSHPEVEGCQRFLDIEIRSPRWRGSVIGSYDRRFKIAGHHCIEITCAGGKPESAGQWRARIHIASAERAEFTANVAARRLREAISRVIEAVGPDTELGIIVDSVSRRLASSARIGANSVEIPSSAHRITGLRHRNALVKWSRRRAAAKSEIGKNPAVRQRIVNNNWIASCISITKSSAPSP